MLESLKLDKAVVVDKVTDSLGGASYHLDSGIYGMTVKMMYMDKSTGGATSVNFEFVDNENAKVTHKETIYITNRAGEPTYKDKKTGDLRPLPGYMSVNSILMSICGKEIHELDTQKATIKVWDGAKRAEVNAEKDVVVDLIGMKVTLGIVKVEQNKQIKGDSGYVNDPSGAIRTSNEIRKSFRFEDGLTQAEIEGEDTGFLGKWEEKWKGEVHNKVAKVAGGAAAGAPGAVPAATKELVFS